MIISADDLDMTHIARQIASSRPPFVTICGRRDGHIQRPDENHPGREKKSRLSDMSLRGKMAGLPGFCSNLIPGFSQKNVQDHISAEKLRMHATGSGRIVFSENGISEVVPNAAHMSLFEHCFLPNFIFLPKAYRLVPV